MSCPIMVVFPNWTLGVEEAPVSKLTVRINTVNMALVLSIEQRGTVVVPLLYHRWEEVLFILHERDWIQISLLGCRLNVLKVQ